MKYSLLSAIIFCCFANFFFTAFVFAQQKQLTADQYFKNNFKEILEPIPQFFTWIDADNVTYIKAGKNYTYNAKTNVTTELAINASAQAKKNDSEAPEIVSKKNNLYLKQSPTDVQLTFDEDKEQNPTISPNGAYVAYTKKNNLYSINLATKQAVQLTTDGSSTILNGYASWVYYEEILGRQSQYRSFWWSPTSNSIAYFRTDESPVPIFTITDAQGQHGYVETQRYPKAGDANPTVKVGFVAPTGGATVWANFDEKIDQYFGEPKWLPNGQGLWVNWLNRKQEDLIIYNVSPTTGSKTSVYSEHQNTWIDLDDNDRLQFINQGKNVLMLSDKTGWRHIYNHNTADGKLVNAVTQGNFTVLSIEQVNETTKTIYFKARSRENTARNDLYSVNFNGKNIRRLTFGNYNHATILSPTCAYAITTYNNATSPSAVSIINTKTGVTTSIGTALAANYTSYALAKTEIIRVKSDDKKYDLPLKITWPLNYDSTKKYPVLISIYGGPNAGTVMDNYTLTGTQQWYAKEGLIQVAMDHRASGHFGKEGVNYMHRNLGFWEMTDYTTMVKWLIANASADPKRVCITGFSYGGYTTCYALTHSASVFTHGMAGGSVTDWSLYDSHYTEKLMDTPTENPEGYKTSSVFTYADKLVGKLQLVHGNIDDNVHIQNSIQLLSKLQDLKKDVEYMPYSGSRHGWGGAKGAHFANLKTAFIYKYLLEKEIPKELLK